MVLNVMCYFLETRCTYCFDDGQTTDRQINVTLDYNHRSLLLSFTACQQNSNNTTTNIKHDFRQKLHADADNNSKLLYSPMQQRVERIPRESTVQCSLFLAFHAKKYKQDTANELAQEASDQENKEQEVQQSQRQRTS